MSVLEALENYHDRCHPVVCTILTLRVDSTARVSISCFAGYCHVGIIGNEQADSAGKVGDDASAAFCSAIGYEARHHASSYLRSGRNHGVSSWITNCTL
ncbi:hypothetical protein TNCV_4564471 [Trichonephila clavipes]|nr:hypothetical protein TNCV_4564471 [Trichonephila clavipes]